MLILKPKVHSTVWGGDYLKKIYPEYDNIGHLYSCVPYGEFDSEIIHPEGEAGKTLSSFLDNNPVYRKCFPYAIAIVTPRLDLSIQVHPPRGANGAKNESWVFLNPPDQGSIYGGCTVEKKQEITDAVKSESLMKYVDTVSIKKRDYAYIEGGTLHAMTAGSVVYEIEEIEGITCRLFDYGRRDSEGNLRPLQIDQGLEYLIPHQRVRVQEYDKEKIYVEDRYTVQCLERVESFVNTKSIPVCVTVLGAVDIDGIKINYGTSVILFPQESLHPGGCDCIVAEANLGQVVFRVEKE